MSLFKSMTFTVKKPSAGSYVKGHWVNGSSPTEFTIQGTAQPSNGDKIQVLLEGKRIQSIYEITTDTKLQATDPLTKTTGDIISLFGYDHEVIQVGACQNGIIPHYECIAIREKEGKV